MGKGHEHSVTSRHIHYKFTGNLIRPYKRYIIILYLDTYAQKFARISRHHAILKK